MGYVSAYARACVQETNIFLHRGGIVFGGDVSIFLTFLFWLGAIYRVNIIIGGGGALEVVQLWGGSSKEGALLRSMWRDVVNKRIDLNVYLLLHDLNRLNTWESVYKDTI